MSESLDIHIEENHANFYGKYLKNIVFGGIDGIITTFSIIAASYGANFELNMIIIMGVANLIADGISMGLGDFLSSYYQDLYIISEKNKEIYEYENNKDYEVEEMIELYQHQGIEFQDATKIVEIISQNKYKDYFIRTMVKYELDLEVPGNNFKKDNMKEGGVIFMSFISFGFIPVLTYILFYAGGADNKNDVFATTCVITAFSMFLLGCFQAKLTKQNILKYGFMTLFNGTLAAIFAFSIGYGLEKTI